MSIENPEQHFFAQYYAYCYVNITLRERCNLHNTRAVTTLWDIGTAGANMTTRSLLNAM